MLSKTNMYKEMQLQNLRIHKGDEVYLQNTTAHINCYTLLLLPVTLK